MKKDKVIDLCFDTLNGHPRCTLIEHQGQEIEFKIETNTLHLCKLGLSSNEYSLQVDTMPNKIFLFDKKEKLIDFFENDLNLEFKDQFLEKLKKHKKTSQRTHHIT